MRYDPLGNMRRLLSSHQAKSALALATRFHKIKAGPSGPAIFSFIVDGKPVTVSITRSGAVVYLEGGPPLQQEEAQCQPNPHQALAQFLRK